MAKHKVKLVAQFRSQLQVDILRMRVPLFQQLHPELDLSVDIVGPDDQVTDRLFSGLARGEKVADIVDLHSNYEVPQALKGTLRNQFLDITQRVADLKRESVGWEPCVWSGRVYGMPTMLAGSAYYFRQDILSGLGIDPGAFETWQDFVKAGKEVKKATGAYMMALDTVGYNHLQPLCLQNGGGWYDESGSLTVDCEANIEVLQTYYNLLKVDEIAMPTAGFYSSEISEAYRAGRIVGAYMPDWYGANELRKAIPDMKGAFRICLAPAFHRGGSRSGYRGGMCASVFRGPAEDVAFELVKFTRLSLEAQIELLEKLYLAPSLLPAYGSPRARDFEDSFLGNQRVCNVYSQIARQIMPFHVGEKLLEVQQELCKQIIPAVISGKESPSKALRDAARALKA